MAPVLTAGNLFAGVIDGPSVATGDAGAGVRTIAALRARSDSSAETVIVLGLARRATAAAGGSFGSPTTAHRRTTG